MSRRAREQTAEQAAAQWARQLAYRARQERRSRRRTVNLADIDWDRTLLGRQLLDRVRSGCSPTETTTMPKATMVDDTPLFGPVSVSTTPPAAQSVCPSCGGITTGRNHQCAQVPTVAPTAGLMGNVAMLMAPLGYGLGTREEIQVELDGMALAVRTFPAKQPDQVMRECSSYSARLTELCVLLHRVEHTDRQYTRVRTQQVERWLTELDRQFRIASRLVEVMRLDLEVLK